MSQATPLFLHRIRMQVPKMIGLARLRRLPIRDVDLGYIAHVALAESFGDAAPQPFVVTGMAGQWVTVLGYATATGEALRSQAQACADPVAYNIIDWDRAEWKPMPSDWQEGQVFGFETRVCPVIRMSSEGPHWKPGAEVDAFLGACWRAGDSSIPISREEVYQSWLAKRMESSGTRILRAEMVQFKLERLIRRTHAAERRSHVLERPAATFRGTLEVTEPERFRDLLGRGLGRHRAFGFGMVLLRSPRADLAG